MLQAQFVVNNSWAKTSQWRKVDYNTYITILNECCFNLLHKCKLYTELKRGALFGKSFNWNHQFLHKWQELKYLPSESVNLLFQGDSSSNCKKNKEKQYYKYYTCLSFFTQGHSYGKQTRWISACMCKHSPWPQDMVG